MALRRMSTAVAALLFLLMAAAAPASAHHKRSHGNPAADKPAHQKAGHHPGSQGKGSSPRSGDHDGDADRDRSTAFTEDNDSDGVPNNVSDAGDNRHPSGKDRSVERGGSGNQGKSESAPDQDGRGPDRDNGGTDKPNGPGGDDIEDQDGNNGCGNDDDFDDDNEGLCGGLALVLRRGAPRLEIGGTGGGTEGGGGEDALEGVLSGGIAAPSDGPEEVLGATLTRSDLPSVGGSAAEGAVSGPGPASGGAPLASTGMEATGMALASLLLVGLGAALVAGTRRGAGRGTARDRAGPAA